MTDALLRVIRDDAGAVLVEYSLLLAGISLSSIVALQAMGGSINSLYQELVANWSNAAHSGQ